VLRKEKNVEPTKHVSKAMRIENTMKKLNPLDDCETIIENCMLAGTHLINASLHHLKISETDILHSDMVKVDRSKLVVIPILFQIDSIELKTAFNALRKIEAVRPEFIRGDRECSSVAMETLGQYLLLKENCLTLLGIQR
jgi:hypothetical protein